MVMRFFGNGPTSSDVGIFPASFDRSRFDQLNQVRAYWEALREDDLPPQRSQLDPRGIEDALSNSFLAERVAPGIARFRIAGMHLADVMGMDVRGMPISACFEPAGRSQFVQEFEQVFAGPALLEMTLCADRGIGRPELEAKLLILPLLAEDGRCNLALGCLVTAGQIGRSPRRFRIRKTGITSITPQRRDESCGKQMEQGFSDPSAYFTPPRARSGHPHLRLVKTDG